MIEENDETELLPVGRTNSLMRSKTTNFMHKTTSERYFDDFQETSSQDEDIQVGGL